MKRQKYFTKLFCTAITIIMLSNMLSGCSAEAKNEHYSEPATQSAALLTDGKAGAVFTDMRDTEESGTSATGRIRRLHTAIETWTPPVELILQDTAVEVQGTTLTYGQLQMKLPEEVTVEEIVSEEAPCVIDLINAEKVRASGTYMENGPVPPRLWLTHYRAEYQWNQTEEKERRLALISALLELMPGHPLRIRFYAPVTDDSRMLLTYERDEKGGYILVCGEDVCFVEEVPSESEYSFGRLLDDSDVQWKDRRQTVGALGGSESDMICQKICPEEGYSFLIVYNKWSGGTLWDFCLYQEGCFRSPYQRFYLDTVRGGIDFEDYNFDGFTDIVMATGQEIFLWDAVYKEYRKVQLPEDFLTQKIALFPETKTIWSYGSQLQGEDIDWNCVDRIEALWQWEGSILVRRRECREETREDTVRLKIYDDALASYCQNQTFTKEEWQQEELRPLYECFYEGFVPEDTYERRHYITHEKNATALKEYIPQGLVDKITDAILTGKELETLAGMVNDRELTYEEIKALARENMDLRIAINWMVHSGDWVMVLADGDNDGIQDIIAEEYYGGTGGFTDYVFYKGNEDGSYQKTDSLGSVREEFGIIAYEGKNYLCRTCYDYEKKIYNGISLVCYVDGKVAETVDLTLIPEAYDIRLAECTEEKYRPLAERIEADSLTYKAAIDEYECIMGSAEEEISEEEWDYQCDLNNDGLAEKYKKNIWLPSNMSTMEHLTFDWNGDGDAIWDAIDAADGRPIMLWADTYEEETVIHIVCLTGLEDFEIMGFVIRGEEYQSIYRITADAVYGVEAIRNTEDFSAADPSKG